MQNFLAKAVAVAMLVGGFGLTGDLGWIADKGQRIVGAADVPAGFDAAVAFVSRDQVAAPESTDGAPTAAPAPAAAPRARDSHGGELCGGPEPIGAAFKPPVGGIQQVEWASIAIGSRVTVWLAGPPYRCLVLDFVDPTSGEALLYEVATVDRAGKPLATAGPPRRVIIGRDEAGGLQGTGFLRGGSIHVAQAGVAGHAAGQWLGPIASLSFNP